MPARSMRGTGRRRGYFTRPGSPQILFQAPCPPHLRRTEMTSLPASCRFAHRSLPVDILLHFPSSFPCLLAFFMTPAPIPTVQRISGDPRRRRISSPASGCVSGAVRRTATSKYDYIPDLSPMVWDPILPFEHGVIPPVAPPRRAVLSIKSLRPCGDQRPVMSLIFFEYDQCLAPLPGT
ncbi:hypothetical protein D9615_007090 [Tricholomella constricta]|uniref:Uncharacterized protein n=1 Tax=Tricholomella constricta TaxID=117010 RepID=A0A8H5M2K4_9AGAR|nr:hypothetical protein D9615_007090 [Tricholomella constricta]